MRARLSALLLVLAVAPLACVTLAPAFASPSVLVIDAASGRTLRAEDADESRYPASLTKMMTLYLLFEAIDAGRVSYTTRLRVSRHAAGQAPSRLGLRPGQTLLVRDAIFALATKSANDAAVVVAEGLAGSEPAFARRMTAKARALGMRRTTFYNASGLPDGRQRTTARDMATLGRALVRDHPRSYRVFATRSFRWGKAHNPNHNRLLGVYRGMDGIKTGYTDAAGFNLVASAVRDGRRLIAVVMKAPTSARRNALMVRLLDQGFADAARAPVAVARSDKRGGRAVATR